MSDARFLTVREEPVQLLIVVSESRNSAEMDVVQLLAAQENLDLKVVAVWCPSAMGPISLTERLYQALDCRIFGRPARGQGGPAQSFEDGDLNTLARRCSPTAILDLTATLTGPIALPDVPVLSLHFEGQPARHLLTAVRQRLGTPQGTVRVCAIVESSSPPRLLFTGACYVDHRSLVRSVELVVRKLPMILRASLRRLAHPQESADDFEIIKSQPPSLGPARLLWRLCASIVRRLLWRDQWMMLVYRDETRVRLERPWVSLCPDTAVFWADPFVVPHPGGVAIFFEELPYAVGKGRISVIDIDDEGHFCDPVVVLEQPWHLSYPFVFEWEGKRYMLPESSANQTLDLYECIEFPQKWHQVKTLIAGQRLADATIIHWQGRLWMFAAHGQPGASNYDELHIFWAEDLFGPWRPHAQNPVKIDAGTARPAGAMFVDRGRLIRPAQDCRNRYGDKVVFQEVTVLDDCRFAEQSLEPMMPGGLAPGEAFHTYNESGRFAAIDVGGSVRRW